MKYFSRAEIYKASNVTFDPKSVDARSYFWWQFVKRIKGQVVFNKYRYSNSTSKHQSKVRQLLIELNIKIDRTVTIRGGLQNIDSIRELNTAENETLADIKRQEEQKRITRNERARLRRAKKKSAEAALARDAKVTLGLV